MEKYTKYEKARILGARALQLSMNAPLLLNLSKEQLEDVSYDPLKIAEIEFNANILPITIKRPFPKKEEEKEIAEDIEEAEEIEEAVAEEPAASPEEKKEEKVARVKDNKKELETEEETDEVEEETAEVEVEATE